MVPTHFLPDLGRGIAPTTSPMWLQLVRAARLALVGLWISMAVGAPAHGEEWPELRRGQWKFTRTIATPGAKAPQVLEISECVDPVADMKTQNEKLTQAGCKFTPPSRVGKVYTFAADCILQGVSVHSTSTLTVEGDSAYSVKVTSTMAEQSTTELLEATRTGDCPK